MGNFAGANILFGGNVNLTYLLSSLYHSKESVLKKNHIGTLIIEPFQQSPTINLPVAFSFLSTISHYISVTYS